jgi:hypothetical protein
VRLWAMCGAIPICALSAPWKRDLKFIASCRARIWPNRQKIGCREKAQRQIVRGCEAQIKRSSSPASSKTIYLMNRTRVGSNTSITKSACSSRNKAPSRATGISQSVDLSVVPAAVATSTLPPERAAFAHSVREQKQNRVMVSLNWIATFREFFRLANIDFNFFYFLL